MAPWYLGAQSLLLASAIIVTSVLGLPTPAQVRDADAIFSSSLDNRFVDPIAANMVVKRDENEPITRPYWRRGEMATPTLVERDGKEHISRPYWRRGEMAAPTPVKRADNESIPRPDPTPVKRDDNITRPDWRREEMAAPTLVERDVEDHIKRPYWRRGEMAAPTAAVKRADNESIPRSVPTPVKSADHESIPRPDPTPVKRDNNITRPDWRRGEMATPTPVKRADNECIPRSDPAPAKRAENESIPRPDPTPVGRAPEKWRLEAHGDTSISPGRIYLGEECLVSEQSDFENPDAAAKPGNNENEDRIFARDDQTPPGDEMAEAPDIAGSPGTEESSSSLDSAPAATTAAEMEPAASDMPDSLGPSDSGQGASSDDSSTTAHGSVDPELDDHLSTDSGEMASPPDPEFSPENSTPAKGGRLTILCPHFLNWPTYWKGSGLTNFFRV